MPSEAPKLQRERKSDLWPELLWGLEYGLKISDARCIVAWSMIESDPIKAFEALAVFS